MELLIGLLAEFIFSLFVPLGALLLEAVVGFFSFVAYALFGIASAKPSPAPSKPAGRKGLHPRVAKILLVTSAIFGTVFVLCLAAAIIVNAYFFAPAMAWIGGKVSERSGIEITFGSVDGSFFAGRFSITDLDVKRRNTAKSEYAVNARRVDIDVDMLSLAWGTPNLDKLTVAGVTGEIWTKGGDPVAGSAKARSRTGKKPRRHFRIASLSITDAAIELHKEGIPSASLAIDSLESAPFRSRYAVLDVFFRSNVTGSINGHEVLIATRGDGTGRTTTWRLSDFPAELVGHYVDKAPFKWFEQGSVDVAVDDTWSRRDAAEIDMDWRIVLKEVKVVKPAGGSLVGRAVAKPIAYYINTREEDIDLQFSLVMNEEQFRSASSLDAAGVWTAVLKGTAEVIAEKSELKVEQAQEKIDSAIDKVKGFLDKKRRKEESAPAKP